MKSQFHVTALRMIEFCGEQFRRRYIEGDRIPPSAYAIVGKGVDRSATKNLQSKLDKKILLPLDEVRDIARDGVITDFDSGEVWMDPEEEKSIETMKGEAVDKAVRLATLHAEVLAPKIEPVWLQREFSIAMPGYDIDLVGTLDVQEETMTQELGHEPVRIVRVRDTKTKRSKPPEDAAANSEQLTGYALALRVIDGKEPDEVTLDFLVDTKTPSAVVRTAKKNLVDFEVFLRRLQAAAIAIEKGVFIPANPSESLCSPRWCGYFSTCKYTKNPMTVAMSNSREKK